MISRDAPAVRAHLPLPPLDLQLLLVLRQEALHGYGMMKAVESQSGGELRVELGSLYRMIHRLERDGLIEETEAEGPPTPGRDRRVYRATPLGEVVVVAELERLRRLLERSAQLWPREARS
jgi:DNA-binding PadR family transcriptional regulator